MMGRFSGWWLVSFVRLWGCLPFCSISRCSQRMSPTKSGARSRNRSLPSAQRLAPSMLNLWKSTFFRLNSFTVQVNHSLTWASVHSRGSREEKGTDAICILLHIFNRLHHIKGSYCMFLFHDQLQKCLSKHAMPLNYQDTNIVHL